MASSASSSVVTSSSGPSSSQESSLIESRTQGPGPSFTPGFPAPPPPGSSNGVGGGSHRQCPDAQGCSSSPPATLYLYTFLSTLIILLIASGGIIGRSVVLRRRQQQLAVLRRRENHRNRHRTRPVMFEAYIADGIGQEDDSRRRKSWRTAGEGIQDRWTSMKPFSACEEPPFPVHPVAVEAPGPQLSPLPIRRAARDRIQRTFSHLPIHNPFRAPARLSAIPPSTVSIQPLPSQPPPTADARSPSKKKLRVAVLVAMPWQETQKTSSNEGTEGEMFLPYLEFGVLDREVLEVEEEIGKQSDESDRGRAAVDVGTKS
ncbi:hypothetical protein R3P38DRAFT_2838361 [Favolaschia claudopus]|uniref:Uncharacterized protein n=1 Tax=Favolaschia claudopus TaxID=2862362 RepID=A0AAW0E7K3_9AGAR